MNLQELKNIINQYKDKIIIKGMQPGKFKQNKLLFQKYKNIFNNISEMIYLVKNYDNLENLHIFCYCGNKNHFGNINSGYNYYCSYKCSNKILMNQKLIKMKNTNILKYGVDNPWKNKDIIKKIKQNRLSNIDKNGLNSYQRQSIKCKNTRLNDINEDGLNSYKRSRIKMLYNINKNGLNSYQRSVLKHKENYLKKYGVDSYFKTNDFKTKVYNTKKKNNSFNKSIQEDQVYNYLLQKFNKNDIERQYKSKEYPFHCDFYIKSLNLYIECNFTWTHYKKPFKNSVEDLIELEKLKKKNTQYYNTAINVWTKRDPLKLQIFKKNKLNYKIFYNLKQFNNWYIKI